MKIFRTWLGIGIQSFGGGVTTLALIRRNVVDIHKWITEEDFNRFWALCQLAPGINLIGLTILIGRKINGFWGIVACLTGLLLPSAFITALLTAGFIAVRNLPGVQGALNGVLPATVGLGFVTACQMANQPLQSGFKRGWGSFAFAVFILVGSGFLLWTGLVSVTVVLLAAAGLGALENVVAARFSAKDSGKP